MSNEAGGAVCTNCGGTIGVVCLDLHFKVKKDQPPVRVVMCLRCLIAEKWYCATHSTPHIFFPVKESAVGEDGRQQYFFKSACGLCAREKMGSMSLVKMNELTVQVRSAVSQETYANLLTASVGAQMGGLTEDESICFALHLWAMMYEMPMEIFASRLIAQRPHAAVLQ